MYDFISAATITLGIDKEDGKGFMIIYIRILLITGTCNNYHNIFCYLNHLIL